MKCHTPIRACNCAVCQEHFAWLDLHIRALAEHHREFVATDMPELPDELLR